ncbi:MAG: hypothetical protein HYY06_22535 [Deltaproteobacteria bacterium]|nr:hypothetical protein [Deltaproteobacteria bacterium]
MRGFLVFVALVAGCGRPDARSRATAPREEQPRPSEPAPGPADELVTIPAGTMHAGSTPGQPGRVPSVEMDGIEIAMEELSIERDVRPQRGLTREQAARICASEERRLCTELEWEWACEGRGHRDHALSPTPTGIRSMGLGREWTSSPWGEREDERAMGFALRGARPGSPERARRCAARQSSLPPPPEPGAPPADTSLVDVGFRCCAGSENEAQYAMEPPRGTFMPLRLPVDRLARIVRSIPELAAVHGSPTTFSQRDVETALEHPGRAAADRTGWRFGSDPLIWTPERGDQLLVVVGKSGRHSFVAALYRLPGDTFRHAASMVLRDDTTPLLLAWGALRRELIWTPCWNCQETEGGKVVYRLETADVRVTHF